VSRIDLFGVTRIECYSSYNVLKVGNLDAIECGVVGVFIAQPPKMAVGSRTGQKTRYPLPEPEISEPEPVIPGTRNLFGNFGY
jgi:hypothetical protein